MMGFMYRRRASAEYRAPHADAVEAKAHDPLQAIVSFADGQFRDIDLALLQKGFDIYLNAEGAIPLERCLGIPSTHTGWRKLRRDSWLRRAALLINDDGITTGSQKLKFEWDLFISRGPWNLWRDDAEPPPDATPLSEALFWATRLNRSESLTDRQIARIVGKIFQRKIR
jgi:hypothetical protein